jgi:primary-amine oxidase
VVDLNTMAVLRIEDAGGAPIPPEPGEYAREFYQDRFRQDVKPLAITQPEGPSFEVEGHQIRWQRWQMRIGFTPREGLVLYQVGYEDQGNLRPILYRASMAEMVVPYGDPRPQHFRKNAFDLGEHGVGMLANSLTNGCDCLGEIRYFDAVLTDSRGQVTVTENAVCLHEEDFGILWKHTDWRRDHVDVRRSRRLVLSFVATVDNYEYGFYWYFYQDGTIQYEIKLTGILLVGALADQPKYGTLVAPEVNALNHQHFFAMRLDFDVDGCANSVYEVNSHPEPMGPDNPYGNGWYAQSTLFSTEKAAQRQIDPLGGRYWKVTNPNVQNRLGQPVGFKLIPGENVRPFAHPDAPIMQRAGFLQHHLWVTPYAADEYFPAGPYPNQHPGGEGLPKWTAGDRPIDNTDVVLWYVFGHHHIPRPEDWPVMPVAYSGFTLKPVGFFDQNPALDVPPSPRAHCHGSSG